MYEVALRGQQSVGLSPAFSLRYFPPVVATHPTEVGSSVTRSWFTSYAECACERASGHGRKAGRAGGYGGARKSSSGHNHRQVRAMCDRAEFDGNCTPRTSPAMVKAAEHRGEAQGSSPCHGPGMCLQLLLRGPVHGAE
jgi:hypothetical protein